MKSAICTESIVIQGKKSLTPRGLLEALISLWFCQNCEDLLQVMQCELSILAMDYLKWVYRVVSNECLLSYNLLLQQFLNEGYICSTYNPPQLEQTSHNSITPRESYM